MRTIPRPLICVVAVVGVLGVACGSDEQDSAATSPTAVVADVPSAEDDTAPSAGPAVSGEVTVFAAASLTEAFIEIGDAFMAENPDTTVTFSFAASSELVTQIGQGAPADVFASADVSNMTKLVDAGDNASEPVVFATNLAEIIVAPGNPRGITGIGDLAHEDLIVILCALEVPCGRYAATILDTSGVTVTPKSLEENVRAVVTKVTLGEADAGIVYATDVTAAGAAAEGVEIPADVNVVAEYPIAVTDEAPNPDGAQAFVEFVTREQGQAILASYGFFAP